jgi:hypothetical protein
MQARAQVSWYQCRHPTCQPRNGLEEAAQKVLSEHMITFSKNWNLPRIRLETSTPERMHVPVKILVLASVAGWSLAGDINRQAIVFYPETPEVFYCPQEKPISLVSTYFSYILFTFTILTCCNDVIGHIYVVIFMCVLCVPTNVGVGMHMNEILS